MSNSLPPRFEGTIEQRIEALESALRQRGGLAGAPSWLSEMTPPTRSDLLRAEGDLENEPALWTPEHDYTPAEDRSVIRALRQSPGVLSYADFRVNATTPASWNVIVGPGRAVIDGTVAPWLQGSYVAYSPSSRTIPVPPAHPTQDVVVVVILHVLDQENSTEEGFGWRREVVVGEPGDLGPPELPPNSLPLRGYRIPAGATALTDLMSFPHVWPWQYGSDLRRPGGVFLYRVFDYKVNAGAGPPVGWIKPTFFDLQVPEAWRSLALWDFDVVMEHDCVAWLWSGSAGTVTFNYDPRDNTATGQTGAGRITGNIQLAAASTAQFAIMDSQLFTPGQSPQWALWWNSTVGTNVTIRDRTVILPRTTTTNRVTAAGLEW